MRLFLSAFVLLFIACKSTEVTKNLPKSPVLGEALVENTSHLQDQNLRPFYHGVASGDPYQQSVVLWTRVTPDTLVERIRVRWEVAADSLFDDLAAAGTVTTDPARDYTVKVIAPDLQAGTSYYYRFMALGSESPIGTTKTLPSRASQVNMAVVSCSNIEFGYFNVYAAIAKDDVDAVIHLGDYIYEYGPDVYGDSTFFRKNIPDHEIISLQDYRDRYSQYRLDKDLQAVHGRHPFINIWDDHEITNNAYVTGAQNHQEDEGDYQVRKAVAKKVFYEWLPVREGRTHYRKFQFGNLAELFMLDERLAGRTVQPDSLADPRRTAEDHTLLGNTQMNWLIDGLQNSPARWKIIGNQVIFSFSDWGYKNFRQNMDAWDGYPNDQKKLANAITRNDIKNVVFITGDTHTAWAFEATPNPFDGYDKETGQGAVGIEFGVTSVTSANANERYDTDRVKDHEALIVNNSVNPHLKYVNMRDHGYLKLSIRPDRVMAAFKIVPTLEVPNANTTVDQSFTVQNGRTKLIDTGN